MFGFGPKIDATKIASEIDSGNAVLVDVRSDDEWHAGHAAGAMHLSIDRISQGETPTQDMTTKIYLYCASGGRAGTAAQMLSQQGFTTENIGGLSSWQAAGGTIQ